VSPNGVGDDRGHRIQAATLPIQEFNTRVNERSRSLNLRWIFAEIPAVCEIDGLNEGFLVFLLIFRLRISLA
jgi:hypothetical protein